MKGEKIYISLGTNLGDKLNNLNKTIELISEFSVIQNLSSVYETAPWGFESDSSFYNMVIELQSGLSPQDLMERCLKVEQSLGRTRNESKGSYESRIIDIDIIEFDDLVIETDDLVLPHPLSAFRGFVLYPLLELNDNLLNAKTKKRYSEYLDELGEEELPLIKINETESLKKGIRV